MALVAGQILRAADLDELLPTPTPYTPANTGVTVGNGTLTARYMRIGKMCHVVWWLAFGTTTAFTANVNIGLPFTCAVNTIISGSARDFGNGTYALFGSSNAGGNQLSLQFHGVLNNGLVNGTLPFAANVDDSFRIAGVYETV